MKETATTDMNVIDPQLAPMSSPSSYEDPVQPDVPIVNSKVTKIKKQAASLKPAVEISHKGTGNNRKFYRELRELIGDETDREVSDGGSDYDGGRKSDTDEDDESDYHDDSSGDEKRKKRKRSIVAIRTPPTKPIASPPSKRSSIAMRTKITDRVLASPKSPGKSHYAELKSKFGMDTGVKGKARPAKKVKT